MWRLHENNKENRSLIKSMLFRLSDLIEDLETLEIGENFNKSAFAYELVLITQHIDKLVLKKYQKHPKHITVAIV